MLTFIIHFRLEKNHRSRYFVEILAKDMINMQPLFHPEVDLVSSKISELMKKNKKSCLQRSFRLVDFYASFLRLYFLFVYFFFPSCSLTEASLQDDISKLESGISASILDSESSDVLCEPTTQGTDDSKATPALLGRLLGNLQQTSDVYKSMHNCDIKQWLKNDDDQNFSQLGETCTSAAQALGSFDLVSLRRLLCFFIYHVFLAEIIISCSELHPVA